MNKFDAISAVIADPSPYSSLQTQYDRPGQDLLQDYIDHAHSVHRSLLDNGGVTVSPTPGSSPLPVGDESNVWYGVGQAPDFSKPGHPATPSREPVPAGEYSPTHTFRHILRTESNRNLGRQFSRSNVPFVGGWRTTDFKGREGEDLVVEDQSTVHSDADQAMAAAKVRNEQAVFKSDDFSDIPNPDYRPQ